MKHGYEKNNKSIWILEGLRMYLTHDEDNNLLEIISLSMCNGSFMFCDGLNESFIDKNGIMKNYIDNFEELTGSKWASA